MTHDEIEELLGAYALDAVDPAERDLVDAHLVTCARCRAEVAAHREVAAMIAFAGDPAPEGVWQRIAGTLDEAPPRLALPAEATVLGAAPSRRRRWSLPAAAVALAAAAAVVAVLGVQLGDQARRIDQLEAMVADPLQPALQAALDQPGARVLELASADGRLVVRGAVTSDGRGYLRATTLRSLAPDRTYQLWGAADGALVSLGVLGPDPGIVAFRDEGYGLFAITDESAPGVVRSTRTPVVAGSITA